MMFLCTEYLEVIAVRRDHLSQVDEDGMMEDVVIRRDKVLQINLLFLHFNSKIFNLRAFQTLSASNLTGNNDFAADGYSLLSRIPWISSMSQILISPLTEHSAHLKASPFRSLCNMPQARWSFHASHLTSANSYPHPALSLNNKLMIGSCEFWLPFFDYLPARDWIIALTVAKLLCE